MSVFDDLFERIAKMKKVLAGKPDFEWAIVKNVSPIMIRLENTGVDIPISSTLIGGLVMNDRVMVMIQRGRVTIIGRGNPKVEKIELPLEPGYSPQTSAPPTLWREGKRVTINISATGTFTSEVYTKVAVIPPGLEPPHSVRSGAMGASMRGYCGIEATAAGNISLGFNNGGSANLSAPSWIQGEITYYLD